MTKAILTFDLDDVDDKMAHLRCVRSINMSMLLFDLRYNFVKELEEELHNYKPKNDLKFDSDHVDWFIDALQDKVNELFDSKNINVDELIN